MVSDAWLRRNETYAAGGYAGRVDLPQPGEARPDPVPGCIARDLLQRHRLPVSTVKLGRANVDPCILDFEPWTLNFFS